MATTYVVLRRTESGDGRTAVFTLAAEDVTTLNGEQACKVVADALSEEDFGDEVTLYAVPARSWKYVTLEAERGRRIKVKKASE
jgi:hypothetical protein